MPTNETAFVATKKKPKRMTVVRLNWQVKQRIDIGINNYGDWRLGGVKRNGDNSKKDFDGSWKEVFVQSQRKTVGGRKRKRLNSNYQEKFQVLKEGMTDGENERRREREKYGEAVKKPDVLQTEWWWTDRQEGSEKASRRKKQNKTENHIDRYTEWWTDKRGTGKRGNDLMNG